MKKQVLYQANREEKKEKEITGGDCKKFTNYLIDKSSKNLSWEKMEKNLSNKQEHPLLLKFILVGLILLTGMVSKKKYICHKILVSFRSELEEILPFSYVEDPHTEKIEVKEIDSFCESLIDWFVTEIVTGCTFFYLVDRICSIFRTDYSTTYLATELTEMIKDRNEGGELTSFSKYKKRKKKRNSSK